MTSTLSSAATVTTAVSDSMSGAAPSTESLMRSAASTPAPATSSANVEVRILSHPENFRDAADAVEKPNASGAESSDVDSGDAEGDMDDEGYDDDAEDSLVSTASFQNGDEVIVVSPASAYNGERARIVDIRGDKLMLSVKDEQVVLTLDEVKSLNELHHKGDGKSTRTSTRIRHQAQPASPAHSEKQSGNVRRTNDRPKRDAAGNGFSNGKSSAAPRSRNNSKAMLGKRVAIVGGRNKGERGRVTKGANGYFTIVLERSHTNPSSNTQVMKRSHDLKVIDGSGDFPVPHRRAHGSGWNKKNKSGHYDDTEDEMDEERSYDEMSDNEQSTRSSKRNWSGYSRSHSRSPSPSFSASHSEMESEPLSDSDSSLISEEENERVSRSVSPKHAVKSKTVANIEREAAQILMDILQARANPQLLKRHFTDKPQSEQQLKRSRTFTYDEGSRPQVHESHGRVHDANQSVAMVTEDYAVAVEQDSHPNLNVIIGAEDHQFYTPLLSSTSSSTVVSHHASPAIAPVVDDSKLYPASPFTGLSAPLQLGYPQSSPSMKAMNAGALNASVLYQKATSTPTHAPRTQFFPVTPTPRSPSSKAIMLPATPNSGALTPQAYPRHITAAGPAVYQSYPSPMPQPMRSAATHINYGAVNRSQVTILSTAGATVM